MHHVWTEEEDKHLQNDLQVTNLKDIFAKWLAERGIPENSIRYRIKKLHLKKRCLNHIWTDEEDEQLRRDLQANLNGKGIFSKWLAERGISENCIRYRMQKLNLKITREKNQIHVEVKVSKRLHFEIYHCAYQARMNMVSWIRQTLQRVVLEERSVREMCSQKEDEEEISL